MKRLLVALLLCATVIGDASADVYRPAYLEIRQKDAENYDLLWKVPARGAGERLALSLELPADVVRPDLVRSVYVGNAVIDRFSISRRGGLDGASIGVAGLLASSSEVLVRVELLDGSTQVARLTSTTDSFVVDAAPGFGEVLRTYTLFGIQHIWQGIDHLLFVACLILIAGSWKRILVTITGFTIAHSITLTLAALGLVRIPVPPVEAVIALSIVFLARELARDRRDTLTWRYPIAVSVSFGLLHGFGFASALAELGLPPGDIPAALLSFNIGVEIGQVLFVALVMIAVRMLHALLHALSSENARVLIRAEVTAIYGIGGLAMFWTLQRLGAFWGWQ
jgi:hydrogenase/urease accessory protein HupE